MAILSGTRQAFWEADLAALLVGAATVPIYPTLTGERTAELVRASGAVVLFAENPLQIEKLALALLDRPAIALRVVVAFDERAVRADETEDERRAVEIVDLALSGVRILSLSSLLAEGRGVLPESAELLAVRASEITPDDVCTLMYTSGTLGEPKGAILTHASFVAEIDALTSMIGLGPHDEQLLVLPMAHVFGRLLELAQLRIGYVTSFAESVHKVMDNLREVNPTFLASVPRFFEKLRLGSEQRAAREGPLRAKLFRWSIEIGAAIALRRRSGRAVSTRLAFAHRYADRVALRHVRAAFGSRFRFAVSGGAPLAREVGEWFEATGLTIVEGYGLSETTAATHTNDPARPRFGTVGKAIPGLSVRLAEDGEILVRGPTVMRGYWNDPDATRAAFDEDGYFRTGDIGVIDAAGVLTITDRKKEIIVTSGGKNIAPQAIESALRRCSFVSQAVVFGDARPYLVALITLDHPAALRWAREHDRETSPSALAADPELRALVQAEVDSVNKTLASFETVKRFHLLAGDFEVARGELTPTQKVRRKAVFDRYHALLDHLYDTP